jgi:hypothetical protein
MRKGDNLSEKKGQEEAIKALETIIQIPMMDTDEMLKHVQNRDWKKLRKTVERIRERKAKYGI